MYKFLDDLEEIRTKKSDKEALNEYWNSRQLSFNKEIISVKLVKI